MKIRKTAILCAILFSLTLFGQAQDEVQILHAEYGARDRWVDVTAQVQGLVHGQGLNFRVDRDNLPTDPAPGERKTLRLRVRNGRGEIQDLTYPEQSVVRLYVRGFAPGPGGPAYGGPGNVAPGYDRRGDDRDRREGYRRGLQITRAEYGAGSRLRDVTARLAGMIRADQLSVRVSSDAMGGDPAHDQPKTLTVWYIYNGRAGQAVAGERDILNLPASGESGYYQSRLQIMRAQYGAESRFVDVTGILNSQIQNDTLNVQVSDRFLGGDPAPGERKVLSVMYVYNGQSGRVFANEHETVTLPPVAGGVSANPDRDDDAYYRRYWPGRSYNELKILEATWGEANNQVNVTDRVNSFVHENHLEMPVTNNFMGGDPAYGTTKYLRVIYLWRGLRYEANATEGQTISIP